MMHWKHEKQTDIKCHLILIPVNKYVNRRDDYSVTVLDSSMRILLTVGLYYSQIFTAAAQQLSLVYN